MSNCKKQKKLNFQNQIYILTIIELLIVYDSIIIIINLNRLIII